MDKPLSPAADDDNDGNKTSPQLPTRRQQQLPEVEEEDKSTMKPKAVVPSNQQQWQLPQTIPKKEETQPEKGKLVNASLSSIGVHAFKVPSLSTPRLGESEFHFLHRKITKCPYSHSLMYSFEQML